MKRILKGLAFSLGTGVAITVARRLGLTSSKLPGFTGPNADAVGRRLDALERRISQVESLDDKLSSQARDVESLRGEIQVMDRRNIHQMAALSQKVEELESRLPSQIEAKISAFIQGMESRLHTELQQTHNQMREALVETVENRVLRRIGSLEVALQDHSKSIGEIRERSEQTDRTAQKLLVVFERLTNSESAQPDTYQTDSLVVG